MLLFVKSFPIFIFYILYLLADKSAGLHGQGKKYTLEGSVCIPCSETTCLRYVHSSLKNSQLDAFSFRLFIWSLLNTASNLSMFSSNVEKTTMSSRYMRHFHQSLKGGWCITETKGHPVKLKETESAHLECCLAFILLCKFNLPVPWTEVQFREILGCC